MGPTHRLIGGTTSFVVSTAVTPALGAPAPFDLAVVAFAVALAAASSSIPDNLEGPPRWLMKKSIACRHRQRGDLWLYKRWPRVPHRTVTHWPALQLAVITALTFILSLVSGVPIAFVALAITGPVALGCVMHSVADAMTVDPRGIQLLWPLSRRGYHLLPRSLRVWVGTKSRSEWAFVAVWCLVVLSYTYARFRHHITS